MFNEKSPEKAPDWLVEGGNCADGKQTQLGSPKKESETSDWLPSVSVGGERGESVVLDPSEGRAAIIAASPVGAEGGGPRGGSVSSSSL